MTSVICENGKRVTDGEKYSIVYGGFEGYIYEGTVNIVDGMILVTDDDSGKQATFNPDVVDAYDYKTALDTLSNDDLLEAIFNDPKIGG